MNWRQKVLKWQHSNMSSHSTNTNSSVKIHLLLQAQLMLADEENLPQVISNTWLSCTKAFDYTVVLLLTKHVMSWSYHWQSSSVEICYSSDFSQVQMKVNNNLTPKDDLWRYTPKYRTNNVQELESSKTSWIFPEIFAWTVQRPIWIEADFTNTF